MRSLLLICAFGLLGLALAPHQVLRIVPGRSVGPYELERTTYSAVRKALGQGETTAKKFVAPRCGQVHYSVVVDQASAGLAFTFYGRKLRPASTPGHITLRRPCDAQTDEGILITSRRADVLLAFGAGDTTGGGLYYGERGIAFTFDTTANRTEEIVAIDLFPPREPSVPVAPASEGSPAQRPPWFRPDP